MCPSIEIAPSVAASRRMAEKHRLCTRFRAVADRRRSRQAGAWPAIGARRQLGSLASSEVRAGGGLAMGATRGRLVDRPLSVKRVSRRLGRAMGFAAAASPAWRGLPRCTASIVWSAALRNGCLNPSGGTHSSAMSSSLPVAGSR